MAFVLLGVGLVLGCSSKGGGGSSTGGSGGSTGASQTIGAQGGTVSLDGVTLNIPAGALSQDTAISVSAATGPAGYQLDSAAYQFGPAGTTFAAPVTVTLPLTSASATARLFWSNASGGFDDLGGTVSGSSISGQITHFSVGFAGTASSGQTFGTASATATENTEGFNFAYESAEAQPAGAASPRLYNVTLATWANPCQDLGANGTKIFLRFTLPTGVDSPPAGTYALGDASASANPQGISVGGSASSLDSSCQGGLSGELFSPLVDQVSTVTIQSSDATQGVSGTFSVRFANPNNQPIAVQGSFSAPICTNAAPSGCQPDTSGFDAGSSGGADAGFWNCTTSSNGATCSCGMITSGPTVPCQASSETVCCVLFPAYQSCVCGPPPGSETCAQYAAANSSAGASVVATCPP